MKRMHFPVFLFGVLSLSLFLAPQNSSAEESSEYLNCLCKCGCAAKSWDCSSVACVYSPDDLTGSPECEDAGNGQCKCQGFGCGRATLPTSGECYDACSVYKTSAECIALENRYGEIRSEYIEDGEVFRGLGEYRYRAADLYSRNWAKMTVAFVYENLSPPADSAGSLITDAVKEVLLDASFPDQQTDSQKAEIQAALLRLVSETSMKMAEIEVAQSQRLKQMKKIGQEVLDYDCSSLELPRIPAVPVMKAKSFPDTSGTTPRSVAIEYLKDNEIIKGYSDGSFQPEKNINRAEFLKILMEISFPEGEAFSAEDCFSDVSSSDWFSGYVCSAKEKGIIGGYPDGSFGPGNTMNGAEMLKILIETLAPDDIPEDSAGEWWQKYWDSASELGIIPADVTSSGFVNRGQMAETMFRALAPREYASGAFFFIDFDTDPSEFISIDDIPMEESEYESIDIGVDLTGGDSGNEEDASGNLLYSNSSESFSMRYPEGWDYDEGAGDAIVLFGSPKENEGDEFMENVNITNEVLDTQMTTDEYADTNLSVLGSDLIGFSLVSDTSVSIAGTTARMVEFTATVDGVSVSDLMYFLVNGTKAWIITCTANPGSIESYRDDFESMAGSFSFL